MSNVAIQPYDELFGEPIELLCFRSNKSAEPVADNSKIVINRKSAEPVNISAEPVNISAELEACGEEIELIGAEPVAESAELEATYSSPISSPCSSPYSTPLSTPVVGKNQKVFPSGNLKPGSIALTRDYTLHLKIHVDLGLINSIGLKKAYIVGCISSFEYTGNKGNWELRKEHGFPWDRNTVYKYLKELVNSDIIIKMDKGYRINPEIELDGIFMLMPSPRKIPYNCFCAVAVMCRIANCEDASNHITDCSIAKSIGLSRSYVRGISKELERMGAIERRTIYINGRKLDVREVTILKDRR